MWWRRTCALYVVRANMHNWSIWCQGSDGLVAHNSLRDGSLENATCARETNKEKLNAWREKSWLGLFSRFSSISSIYWVARHQMKLIRARCCAQSGPSLCAKLCSVLSYQVVWPIDILSENAASRNRFFQVHAIQNKPYLDNISTNWWYIVGFQ